jgi:1,4-dihydroxy-6-naphthoate synthase
MTEPHDERPVLRIGHSPDPDDAFMWWPLLAGADGASPLDTGRFRYESVVADIEALNHRSEVGDLEITAMSCAQYPRVQERYALTACGASLGEGYGPKLVAGAPTTAEALTSPGGAASEVGPVVAVPGRRTSAFGLASLRLGPGAFRHAEVGFDEIIAAVADGTYDAGVVIHEGQLTYEEAGLHLVEDLGAWWWGRHGLPVPLGVNAVRRDLDDAFGPGTATEVTAMLRRSLDHALAHREEAIRHALVFARGMGADVADSFVSLYVNRWTLDFGPTGREAVRVFLDALHDAGLAPPPAALDVVPSGGTWGRG